MRLPGFRRVPVVISPGDYVRDHGPAGSGEYVEHLHGADWTDAPLPPRRHACWPQSRVMLGGGERAERCACGAYRDELGPWIERNSRTPRTPAEQAEHDHLKATDALLDEFDRAEQADDRARMASILPQLRELFYDKPAG